MPSFFTLLASAVLLFIFAPGVHAAKYPFPQQDVDALIIDESPETSEQTMPAGTTSREAAESYAPPSQPNPSPREESASAPSEDLETPAEQPAGEESAGGADDATSSLGSSEDATEDEAGGGESLGASQTPGASTGTSGVEDSSSGGTGSGTSEFDFGDDESYKFSSDASFSPPNNEEAFFSFSFASGSGSLPKGETPPSVDEIVLKSDLEKFIQNEIQKDGHIAHLSVDEKTITAEYRLPARLFGFIPIHYTPRITIRLGGGGGEPEVTIEKPWWLFLASDESDAIGDKIASEMKHILDEKGDIDEKDISSLFQRIALLLQRLFDILRSFLE